MFPGRRGPRVAGQRVLDAGAVQRGALAGGALPAERGWRIVNQNVAGALPAQRGWRVSGQRVVLRRGTNCLGLLPHGA